MSKPLNETQAALISAKVISTWARGMKKLKAGDKSEVAAIAQAMDDLAARLLELSPQVAPDDSGTKLYSPTKTDLVEMLIEYCEKLPEDFTEEPFDTTLHLRELGYQQGGASARSLLGEEWVTSSGRRFCLVALCPYDPHSHRNRPITWSVYHGNFIAKEEMKAGLDCTGIGYMPDPGPFNWDTSSPALTLLREVPEGAFAYGTWTIERIHHTRMQRLMRTPGLKRSKAYFKAAAAVEAISKYAEQQP